MADTTQNQGVTQTPYTILAAAVRCLAQANYASAFVALEEEENIDWLEAITGFSKDGERFDEQELGFGCNGFMINSSF
ncbi:unnamed protein product [Arabidopsis thaliana]|uniref:Uncharacterized protein n=1 Tax=Arabidopsis thaliana TaxID=3702 RepID=A0A5S9WZ53_ARATH|nr:unnamed protein product [Arabidopsis thaliana]